MSSEKKSSTTAASSEKPTATNQPSSTAKSHADAVIGEESEQGFRGTEVDPTPNENYTVAGVTKDAPTPETDVKAAAGARDVTGLGLSALEATERDKKAEDAGRKFADKKRSNR